MSLETAPEHHAGQQPDHQKISFTAKLVALGRATTAIPFAKDVSQLTGAQALGEDLAKAAGSQEAMPSLMAPLVEARYLSLVSAIKRSGVRQVLEFASGVSLRGLAMAINDPTLTYVETDLPALTNEKRGIMQTILARHEISEPMNHHVAIANILDWEQIRSALVPLTPNEPVAIVHEGLFMYLSHEEKEVAARNIKRILESFGGVWLTPDFSPMASMEWLVDDSKQDFSKLTEAIEQRTGRSFVNHSFASEEAAAAFCERLGFSVDVHSQIDGTYELTSLPKDLGPKVLDKMRDHLKLWEMRLPSTH